MAVRTDALKNQLQHRQTNHKPAVSNSLKQLLDSPAVKKRFEQLLEKRAPQFMSSIVNLVNSDTNLQKCDPMTVISSCMVAATLNLPVDKNLGYSWVIPYGNRAQFQLGSKGYIQLALRSGQYKYINVIEVYEGELVKFNRLTEELEFDESKKKSDHIIGYAAYFQLLNGFRKTIYWTTEDVEAHRDRFSKGAKRQGSVWETDFSAMAQKTVLKSLLSKWGILSIEMQQAFIEEDNAELEEPLHAQEIIDIQVTEKTEVPTDDASNEIAATSESNVEDPETKPIFADSVLPF